LGDHQFGVIFCLRENNRGDEQKHLQALFSVRILTLTLTLTLKLTLTFLNPNPIHDPRQYRLCIGLLVNSRSGAKCHACDSVLSYHNRDPTTENSPEQIQLSVSKDRNIVYASPTTLDCNADSLPDKCAEMIR